MRIVLYICAVTPHKVKETVALTDELFLPLDIDVIHSGCDRSYIRICSLCNLEQQASCIALTAVHTSFGCDQVSLCKTHVPRVVQECGETGVTDEFLQPVLSGVLSFS